VGAGPLSAAHHPRGHRLNQDDIFEVRDILPPQKMKAARGWPLGGGPT